MINIITAMNNSTLNEELKKEKNINLFCKDIFYKEGILEILENKKEIDYIILDYNLPGQIELNELLKNIKNKNEKIKIILTIKKGNKINFQNKNIIKIFYKNNINLNYLKNYNNLENKKIKNNNYLLIKKIKTINYLFNKNFNNKIYNKNENDKAEIVVFFGENQVGKFLTILNISYFLENKKNKILIIEIKKENKNNYFLFNKKINLKNKNIKKYKKTKNKFFFNKNNKTILEKNKIKISQNIDLISINNFNNFKKIEKMKKIEKNYNYIFIKINLINNLTKNNKIINEKYKKIILIRPNLIGIKNAKKIIEKNNLKNEKIIINNYNKYSIDEKIIKNIFKDKKIIGKIKYDEKYEELINTKFKNIQKYLEKNNFEMEHIVQRI